MDDKLTPVESLPFPTWVTDVGPVFQCREGRASILYDFEDEGGRIHWTQVDFHRVVAFRFVHFYSGTYYSYYRATGLLEMKPSSWIEQLQNDFNNPGVTFSRDLRHFLVFFDHVGYFEVIASEVHSTVLDEKQVRLGFPESA